MTTSPQVQTDQKCWHYSARSTCATWRATACNRPSSPRIRLPVIARFCGNIKWSKAPAIHDKVDYSTAHSTCPKLSFLINNKGNYCSWSQRILVSLMDSSTLISFATFAMVSAFTPGPNNVMLAASGANFGFCRTLPHIFGILVGFCSLVVAAGLGLASLFAVIPWFYNVLKVISVLFLANIPIDIFR